MPGLLTLLIVALATAGVAALAIAVVLLHRQGRLDARRGIATGALTALMGAAATLGIAALNPAPVPATTPGPVSVVTVVEQTVDVQLPTLALDE